MEKSYFDNDPSLVTIEGSDAHICFDVTHEKEKRITPDGGKAKNVNVIKAYSVWMKQPLTRPAIINAIVSAGYPHDKMEAIINNYLLDEEDPESLQEFTDMQSWRTKAKEVATQVIEELEGLSETE